MRDKVTAAQRRALRMMADGDFSFGLNSTNMTGCALQRMGLAKFIYNNVMVSGVGQWRITPEGRAFLASGTLPRENNEDCSRAKPSGPTLEERDAQTPTPSSRERK